MVYNYKVTDVDGNEVSLEEYKGKVMLIVNTATGCGFTPQYDGLEKLYEKYRDKGLEILDFPCNQFLEQAPGDSKELASFCKVNFGTEFKTFAKIDVNGENAHDLYKYLRAEAPSANEDEQSQGLYEKLQSLGFTTSGDEIKWNFTKFLVDREGKILGRFAPTVAPEKLDEIIAGVI